MSQLQALRTLRVSTYPKLNNFNLPVILDDVDGLRELIIEAPTPKMVKVVSKEGFETYQHVQDSASDLRKELYGYLPMKVRSITISGAGFNVLSDGIFDVSVTYNITVVPITDEVSFFREFKRPPFM